MTFGADSFAACEQAARRQHGADDPNDLGDIRIERSRHRTTFPAQVARPTGFHAVVQLDGFETRRVAPTSSLLGHR